MEMSATTLDELEEYSHGQLIRLPDFVDGMPLYVKMRRPSILSLMKDGKIPNPLAQIAVNLFMQGGHGVDSNNPEQMKELAELFHIFCKASFVEPTYQQIKEAGLELNDDQLIFVSNFVQAGTKALERFRWKPKSAQPTGNVQDVQKDAVRAIVNK